MGRMKIQCEVTKSLSNPIWHPAGGLFDVFAPDSDDDLRMQDYDAISIFEF